MVYEDGRLAVANFATACRCLPDQASSLCGTFWCCTSISVRPPELLLGLQQYWPSVDMWGLGVLLADMALGHDVLFVRNCEEVEEAVWCAGIFRHVCNPSNDHPLSNLPGFHLARRYAQELPCLLYTSPSPRDGLLSRMPSSA